MGVVPQIKSIQVKCDEQGMKVAVEFDIVFNGIIYSKGHYADDTCKYVKENSLESKYDFAIPVDGCGTMRSDTDTAKGFENIIIFQNDPVYQEVWDSARLLSCRYIMPKEELLTEKRVVFKPFLVEGLDIIKVPMQSFVGDAHKVDCWMDIKKGKYPELSVIDGPVRVGENLTLIIAIKDTRKNTDIRVKDCYAFDNADNAEKNDNPLLKLSGEDGCPLKEKLMDVWRRTKKPIDEREASLVAYTTITAFKFPQHTNVHLTCNVELCKEECADRCEKEPKELIPGDGGTEGEKPDDEKPDEPDEKPDEEEKPDKPDEEEKPDKPDEEKPDEKPDEEEEKPDKKPDEDTTEEDKDEDKDEEKDEKKDDVTTAGDTGDTTDEDKGEDDKDDGGEKDETSEDDKDEGSSEGTTDGKESTTEASKEEDEDKDEDNESTNGDADTKPDTKPSKPPTDEAAVTFTPKDEEEEEEDAEGSEATGAIKGSTQETLEDDDEENDISTTTTVKPTLPPIKSISGTKTKQKRKNEVKAPANTKSPMKKKSSSSAARPSASPSSSSRDSKKVKDSIISRPPAFKPRPSRKAAAVADTLAFAPKLEKRILENKNTSTTTRKPLITTTTVRKHFKSTTPKKLKPESSKLIKLESPKPSKNTTSKPVKVVTQSPKSRALRPVLKKENPKAAVRKNNDKDLKKQKSSQDLQLPSPKTTETTTASTTTTTRPTTTTLTRRTTRIGRNRVPPPTTTTAAPTSAKATITTRRPLKRLAEFRAQNSTTQTTRKPITPRKPEPVYTLPIPAALIARPQRPQTPQPLQSSTVSDRRWDGDAPFNDFSAAIAYEAKRISNVGTRHIRSIRSVLSLFTPPRVVHVTLSI